MSQLINEAFKELEGLDLDEELFSFDEKGARDLSYFLKSDTEPVLDIIDPLATEEDELQPSYEGNVICQCCVCRQLIYKKPEEIVIDEETQNANVGEECPHCYNTRGYKVIGQVEPYFDKEETKVTVDGDDVEVKAEKEEVTESLNESLSSDQLQTYMEDSFKHLGSILGRDPTYDELIDDLLGNYEGMEEYEFGPWDTDPALLQALRKKFPGLKEASDELEESAGSGKYVIYDKEYDNYFAGNVGGRYPNKVKSIYSATTYGSEREAQKIIDDFRSRKEFANVPRDRWVVREAPNAKESLKEKEKGSRAELTEKWEDAYRQFTVIVDNNIENPDQIEKQVDALYAKHKGEKDWDFAYRRWMEGSESLDENLDDEEEEEEFVIDERGKKITSIKEAKRWLNRQTDEYGNTYSFPSNIKKILNKLVDIFGNTYFWFREDESLNESRTDNEIIDDYIGRRGKFRGYITAEVKPLYDTWDDKLKRPTAPEEIEDYEKLRDTYGKTVEITDCSIFIKGNSRIDTFNTSYWDVKFNDGTSLSSVSGSDIDLYEDIVKTKKGRVNKGKAGIHETFKTKKAADAQRKAMFASGYKGESLKEDLDPALVAKMDKESFVNYVTTRKGWTSEEAEDYLKTYFDEALDEKLTVEVTEEDINQFDEDTGDVVVDKTKFVGKDIKKGDYVTLKFTDENEDADTQDYKFVEETEDGFKLEWIGTKELHEDFQKATVETGNSILSMESDDDGKVTVTSEPRKAEEGGEETIAPLSDEVVAEIEEGEAEETEEEATEEETTEEETIEEDASEGGGEEEVSVDEFEESYFNDLGKKYLQEVYNNVTSYETTKGSIDGKKIKLEGVISFKSGKKVKTEFFFEGRSITKSGKVRFLGENAQITNKRNAFILTGSVSDGKLFTESLTYNYRAKDASTGKTVREYGTVRR